MWVLGKGLLAKVAVAIPILIVLFCIPTLAGFLISIEHLGAWQSKMPMSLQMLYLLFPTRIRQFFSWLNPGTWNDLANAFWVLTAMSLPPTLALLGDATTSCVD